jgi:glucosamine kinase
MQPDQQIFLGIDGGGSHCRARIRDQAGNLLGQASGGASNIYQDFDGTIATIIATAKSAAAQAGEAVEALHAGLGIAGIVTSVGIDKLSQIHLPFRSVTVNNDAHAACIGAFCGGDGGIVITGTGSVGYAIIGGQPQIVGGWGFQIGDHGSGAWLGHHAVRRAALAMDGLIEPTELIKTIWRLLGGTRMELSHWSEQAKPVDYAELAPYVFDSASNGDVVGTSVVVEGAAAISSICHALLARGAKRLCLLGGLSSVYPNYLDADIKAFLVAPQADAMDGAIMMARQAQGFGAVWS